VRSGIGNQLFQFSFAYALSRKFNYELILSPILYVGQFKFFIKRLLQKEVRTFQLPLMLNEDIKIVPGKNLADRLLQNEVVLLEEFRHNQGTIDAYFLQKKDIYLRGYWQNPELFLEYASEIRDRIKPRIQFSLEYGRLSNMLDESYVGIHVRRGDFLTNSAFGACRLNYYLNAIKLIESKVTNPKFFIFTNDKEWVERNLASMENVKIYLTTNKQNPDIEEFYLLSQFRSIIISNSTFSWWSAYLGTASDKVVIAPKKWFLKKDLQVESYRLIQSNWIAIENDLELIGSTQ